MCYSEIYPYVVITLGLENILIIVKAVITTPEELEVSEPKHLLWWYVGVGSIKHGKKWQSID